MYQFKNVLVGLDFSPLDTELLRYTSYLANKISFEKVYFIHVVKSLHIPKELQEKYPRLINGPEDENLVQEIKQSLELYYDQTLKTEINIEIKEGNAADQILRWTDLKEVDLVIMGNKKALRGSGTLPTKLVKLTHCSVLLIPESSPQTISKILVPTDFSRSSRMAAEEAGRLAKLTGAEVVFQHSYEVPTGYHTTGKTYDEFAEIMKEHSVNDFKAYIRDLNFDGDPDCVYNLNKDHDPAEQAFEIAEQINADLIIIGSKGRTNLASVILGSVAEKMARYDKKIPLLVVKNKEENLTFFKALLRL